MIKPLKATLDVVAVISNPVRYEARYKLYRKFEKHMHDAGVRLTTVELAFGNREWEVTEADDPRDIRLRSQHELWHKENLINIGISRLPENWEYVAWIDTDVLFNNPLWAQETLQQLQHYSIVQMWSQALDLGPKYHPARPAPFLGWVYCKCNDIPRITRASAYFAAKGQYWHPGFAWAATRAAMEELGGLLDWAIVGGADYHMAAALTGVNGGGQAFFANKKHYQVWVERAKRLKENIGYVDGMITHGWHGRKKERGYADRWKILASNNFDPDLDLKRDWQGIWQLTDRNPKLRDDIRSYFRARNEDSIDLE